MAVFDPRTTLVGDGWFSNWLRSTKRHNLYDPEKWRKDMIERFAEESGRRRDELFHRYHPHAHHSRMLHANAFEVWHLARAHWVIRKIGWRGAQWQATMRALDWENNETHLKFLMGLALVADTHSDDRMWRFEAHSVPEGVPLGTPTASDIQDWHPETTLWDLGDAAKHELFMYAGGEIFQFLYVNLAADDPRRRAVEAARTRVELYLNYYYNNRNNWPDDPYDPNNWGHDTRLKNFEMRELRFNGKIIVLEPSFDPDVLEYTVNQPLLNAVITITEFYDPLLTFANNITTTTNRDSTVSTVTVRANDGTTTRTYTFRVDTD